MRSMSIVVRMTPRQAVAAMRACELAGETTEDARAYPARHRIMCGLMDAGWTWDDDTETWNLETRTVPDPS